jgi:hypothetical protein
VCNARRSAPRMAHAAGNRTSVAANSIFSTVWNPVCRRPAVLAITADFRPDDRPPNLQFCQRASDFKNLGARFCNFVALLTKCNCNYGLAPLSIRGLRRFQRVSRHCRPISSGREPLALGRALGLAPDVIRGPEGSRIARQPGMGVRFKPDPVSGSVPTWRQPRVRCRVCLRTRPSSVERHLAAQGSCGRCLGA